VRVRGGQASVSGFGYVELHQEPVVTMLMVGFAFLNRTEPRFEPAADGSLVPQVRIDRHACASRMCDQVVGERTGGIWPERTASGRGA
jgi:hypothetical protein